MRQILHSELVNGLSFIVLFAFVFRILNRRPVFTIASAYPAAISALQFFAQSDLASAEAAVKLLIVAALMRSHRSPPFPCSVFFAFRAFNFAWLAAITSSGFHPRMRHSAANAAICRSVFRSQAMIVNR